MVRLGAALLLLLAASAQPAPPNRPAVTRKANRVMVTLPESVLKDSRVRTRLESALTTTFLVKSRAGAARIEIRYDLWDDVYHAKRIELPNRVTQQKLANAAELAEWWGTPIDAGAFSGDPNAIAIELVVLPFSAAEESDARQWLSKSGGAGGPAPDANSVVDVLIGTTLSARPIVSYRWNVEIR